MLLGTLYMVDCLKGRWYRDNKTLVGGPNIAPLRLGEMAPAFCFQNQHTVPKIEQTKPPFLGVISVLKHVKKEESAPNARVCPAV